MVYGTVTKRKIVSGVKKRGSAEVSYLSLSCGVGGALTGDSKSPGFLSVFVEGTSEEVAEIAAWATPETRLVLDLKSDVRFKQETLLKLVNGQLMEVQAYTDPTVNLSANRVALNGTPRRAQAAPATAAASPDLIAAALAAYQAKQGATAQAPIQDDGGNTDPF